MRLYDNTVNTLTLSIFASFSGLDKDGGASWAELIVLGGIPSFLMYCFLSYLFLINVSMALKMKLNKKQRQEQEIL